MQGHTQGLGHGRAQQYAQQCAQRRTEGRPTSGATLGAVVGALSLVALAACGGGEGPEPQADATHEVCVGTGARDGAWTVEVVQDDEVVAMFATDGAGASGGEGDGPVAFAVAVAPDVVSTVRFTDGEVIGERALAPGGVAEWVVGEGCP